MPNPHGTPIWYELMSDDPDATKAFYDPVVGWTIEPEPSGELDYRMITTSGGDNVGGVMRLTAEMKQGGARPGWFFYIGVDDVDSTVANVTIEGGSVIVPAWTIEGVGRMALVADPQGIPFYVMRGASDESSTAFDRTGMGKCNWNELTTPDQAAAHAFYGAVFGWTYPDKMAMPGDMGDYFFVDCAGNGIGATMTRLKDGPRPGWRFYFRAPDIEAAAQTVSEKGGAVHHGPSEVPGGDQIIIASDPAGVPFGVVGPGN